MTALVPADPPQTLSVLTQNAFGGGPGWDLRCQRLARRIRALAPDVVGLQEIHAHEPSGRSGQAHELAALVGDYHVEFAPARVERSGACEGVALLTREPVRDRSVEALSLDEGDPLERPGRRVVLSATLAHGVDVFVTHLSLSRRARSRTTLEVLAFADAVRRRSGSRGAVLVGDLNALPDEAAIANLEACPDALGGPWLDVWKHAGSGGGATWPSLAPWRRLDYVFIQPMARWTIEGCAREPVTGSDHRGVAVQLRLAD